MSKKQTMINNFFKRKSKDYVLEPNYLKSWSPSKNCSKRNRKNISDSTLHCTVISLLSSDEDNDDKEMIANQSVQAISPSSDDMRLKNELATQPSPIKEPTAHEQLCDETINTGESEDLIHDNAERSFTAPAEQILPERDDYKLNNFMSMIKWVLDDETNSHLFNAEDWNVIENYKSMSSRNSHQFFLFDDSNFTYVVVPSQRLYVRLYVRKHRWIRSSKISYPELGEELQPLINELVEKELLLPCNILDNLEEVLKLLDSKELRSCAKSINGVNLSKITSKQSLMDAILKHAKSSRSIQNFFAGKKFTVEQVILNHVKKMLGSSAISINENCGRLFSRMTYLFYPPQVNDDENGVSLSHQLFNQLKVENGELTYPKYKINKSVTIYKTREDLILYEAACRLENQILLAIEKRKTEFLITELLPQAEIEFHKIFANNIHTNDLLLPYYLRNQTAGHIYIRCLTHLVSVLEQQKHHLKAVDILKIIVEQNVYCQYYKGKCTERLAIDLDKHLKKPKDALEVIINGLKDPYVKGGFRYSIYQRGERLSKSLNPKSPITFNDCNVYDFDKCPEITISAETLDRNVNGRQNIFAITNNDGDITCLPVEEVALRHYKGNGFTHGLHSEGIVYHALLNLLLWDIIYSDVPDAFRTCNQSLPLDFSSEDFYSRREHQIQERFLEIKNISQIDLAVNLEEVWTENYGASCLISWDAFDIQTLKDIAYCLGNETIVAIFERMCHHFRFARSGFPDLLVWNVETKVIKAVEVKGPNDILSSKQILWLQYFNTNGFQAEVCYVKSVKNCKK